MSALYHTPPLVRIRKPYALMCRTSSINQQREGTIQAQLDDWALFCTRNGIDFEEDTHYFLDDGVSGGINIWERPAGAKLREWIEDGYVTKTVYTLYVDRVNREDTRSMGDLIELCQEYNLNYATVKDGINTSDPSGETWAMVRAEISRDENRKRTERFMSGKRTKAKQGIWIMPQTPFGVRLKADRTLEIDPAQAQIILEWKRLIEEEGKSLREIATESTKREYVSATGKTEWSHTMVSNYLHNPALYGEARYNTTRTTKRKGKRVQLPRDRDEWIIVRFSPPIMTRAEWERMHQAIDRNASTYAKNGNFSKYTMLSVLHCAKCKARFYPAKHIYNRPQYDKSYTYYNYRHDWHTGKARACNPSIQRRALIIDEMVWSRIVEAVLDRDAWREELIRTVATRADNRLEMAQGQHREAKARLEELDHRYWDLRQLTSEQYDKRLPLLQNELIAAERTLKEQLSLATEETTRRERIAALDELLDQFIEALKEEVSLEDKRDICAALLRRVEYDYEEKEISSIEWAL